MPEIYFRIFTTRGRFVNIQSFRRVIGEGLRNEVFPDIIRMHDAKVRHWKKRPTFTGDYDISSSGIAIRIWPAGSAADIWWIHNQGHDEYVIKPSRTRRKQRIARRKERLGSRYRRDTRKIGRLIRPMALKFKGLGGEVVYRKQVVIKAREGEYWDWQVASAYKPTFQRKMENILRRAVRAAQREA